MKKLLLPIALIVFSISVSADDIWSATVRGDKQAVQKFLDNGVSIESKRNGGTPLWYAASYAGSRKEEMIRFIVSKGGNLNAKYEGPPVDGGLGTTSQVWMTILHHFRTKN